MRLRALRASFSGLSLRSSASRSRTDRICRHTDGMNRKLRVVAGIAAAHVDDRRKFTLRLSDELAERLAQAARDNDRSLNAEIVARLRQSVSGYRT